MVESSTNRSCTSAKTSWFRTLPDGAVNGCPTTPRPRTLPLRRTGCARVLSVSTRRLDLHGKRPIHAREGVPHLWLLDPADRALEAFELRDGQWVLIASAKDDDPICIRPFDAITFSLGDLWP